MYFTDEHENSHKSTHAAHCARPLSPPASLPGKLCIQSRYVERVPWNAPPPPPTSPPFPSLSLRSRGNLIVDNAISSNFYSPAAYVSPSASSNFYGSRMPVADCVRRALKSDHWLEDYRRLSDVVNTLKFNIQRLLERNASIRPGRGSHQREAYYFIVFIVIA